ncbi:MAG: pentapeptide repeat-containing protein, partial [Caldilineaceae bacterium]|nr:pentapeptide repeat-containing protein [Caldilineaceae bacterium]
HNGQRALALAQYETCRSLLQKEFGAEPSAEMTAQYQRIKAGARSTIETIFPEHSPNEPHEPPSHREAREIPPAKFTTQVDWGDIPRQATFYNRQEEITQLRHRLVGNPHSVVGLIGTGGMGKTVLAAHMVRILATQDAEVGSLRREMRFEHIIWRSLINAPSLYTIVRSWVQILTDDPPIQWPTDINDLLDLLFELLQKKRCLLILDNLESILQEDTHAGYFQDGHENYAVLLRRMGETVHRSCLFFTSRELPIIVAQLERSHSMVWTEYLKGFDTTSGVQLLMAEGLAAPPSELAQLVEGYSGNPLALKLVAETVQYLYGNNVAAFLRDRALIFDDIRTVLDQQFNRLLPFEKEILCWLAIERKPVPLQKLSNNWVQTPPQRKFLEAVRSLQRRGLIEYVTEAMATNGRNGALASLTPCFTLQNVVMEFVSDQVVERIFSELVGTPLADSQLQHSSVAQFKLNRYGLLKSHSQIYVRDMQVRLLLQPLLRRLLDQWGRTHTVTHLRQWIDYLRREQFGLKGYAGANILHMLLYLDVDLTNWDFSRIYIRQADLRAASMINVDLRGADLTGSTFANIMGSVTALAMSPNGQYLTSSSSDGDICIWHMQDFQIRCMLQGHKHAINSLCFANDGSLLLSGGVDGFINVWDVASGKLIRSMKNLDKSIIAISLHCDDIYLAVALTDETIQIWNWQQTELVKTLHTSSTLEDVTFSPDGKFLVSVGDEQQINVWKVDNFELLHSLEGHAGKILAVAFNAKSNLLATAGEDKQIWLWDVDTFQLQQVLTGHTDLVLALSFSQNGHFLASSSADQTARTWNLQTGKLDRLFNDHYGWVNSVTFGANDQTLITGGYDQTIRVWEPHSGQLRLALKGHLKRVDFISFGADGQYLAASSLDGLVHLWNVQTATLHHVLKDSKAATRGLVFNRACTLLVTASDDHNIRLWNTHTGQMRQLLRGHTGFVRSIQFSADEQFVISGSRDYSIRIWEVSSGKLMRTISDVNATIQFAF